MAKDRRSFSDRFWNDKDGNFVMWQKPNAFLSTAFAAAVISLLLPASFVHTVVGKVGMVAILIWAVLETFRGVNYFRRTLGLCVLLLPVIVMYI